MVVLDAGFVVRPYTVRYLSVAVISIIVIVVASASRRHRRGACPVCPGGRNGKARCRFRLLFLSTSGISSIWPVGFPYDSSTLAGLVGCCTADLPFL